MPIASNSIDQVTYDDIIIYIKCTYMTSGERESMTYLLSPDGQQAIADGIITLERYLEIPQGERKSMKYLFSPDGRRAVADRIITLEQYLKIPEDDRYSMKYLFSPDGRQAMDDGIITLKEYLKIPENDRYSMRHLFSPDGRQAITERIITIEQYLRIPWNERDDITPLFSPNNRKDRQAIADGIITLEQYLEIPCHERESMQYLFSPDGRRAMDDGIITLDRYLQIPAHIRENMQYLFSPDGRQAIADKIITIERYLQIPWCTFCQMPYLFSADGRQSVADGIITLEQYLQLEWYERNSMQYLFSPAGRQAVADEIITLDRYLQIPPRECQNVMTALQDPDTRQRIINGQITIENIIGARHHAHAVTAPNVNGAQSTHTTSVHESVSESATQLANRYKSMIDGAGLKSTIGKAQAYINNLPDDSEKNTAAKRGFLRIVAPDYTFTDPKSQISTRQLLALAFLAIHDAENRLGSLEDAEMQFVEALYEIQREYNLSKSGIDLGGQDDQYTCPAGTFNKLIEKLVGIHPDCRLLFITGETASFKLPIVVREEVMRYLTTFAKPNTAETPLTLTRLITQVKKDGVEVIWEHIKGNIATRMFDEFGSLYRDRTNSDFTALVDAGKDVELGNLNTFREYAQISLKLNELENKAKNLRDHGHTLASSKATTIVNELRDLNHGYFIEKKIEKKIDSKTYKARSLKIINQERSELDKHRGYKQILGNLLILIITLGTGQLLNKACTGKFLFFNSTDSSKKLDDLNKIIEKVVLNKN